MSDFFKTYLKLIFIYMMTLEERVLDFINNHPDGVKVIEMEKPFGETRMKLGFVVKNLLEKGMIKKVETAYFPKVINLSRLYQNK